MSTNILSLFPIDRLFAGWKVVLNFNCVPISYCKLCQNLEVNQESQSDTMAVFDKRSTTTYMASSPNDALDNPTKMSTAISSHFHSGMSSGQNIHARL
jgi:hypothetical protein